MLGSDVLRDKYGIFDAVSIMHGQGSPMERQNELLEALDHHNAAGRLRAESRDADQAAETANEHVEAEAEVEAKYSAHALTAAASEAKDADLPVEEYLDSLSETQRETLFDEHDRGIEDSQERDDRIETAQHASSEPAAAEELEPAASHETRADVAQEERLLVKRRPKLPVSATLHVLPMCRARARLTWRRLAQRIVKQLWARAPVVKECARFRR